MIHRARLLALTLSLCGLVACAHAPGVKDAPEIDAFSIEGTKALKEGDIKEKIVTAASSWWPGWMPWLGHTEWFDESAWQADLRRITRFYEANGYYQARILDEQVTLLRPGHVGIFVRLHEGEPARTTAFTLTGLEDMPEEHARAASEKLPLEKGHIFLEGAWLASKAALASRLRELGYAEVQVSGEALVDAAGAGVNASLVVRAGQRFRFGRPFVATDPGAQVPSKLIASVAALEVAPGDWYSDSALEAARARVFRMGVFSAVKVTRGATNREQGDVPTIIDVKEAPFRSLRAGAGLNFDLIRNEIRLVGEFSHRNLGLARLFNKDQRLDRLTLKGKLGWAALPNIIAVATQDSRAKHGPIGRLLTEYEVPRAFGLHTMSFVSSINLERTLDVAYDYAGGELKLGLEWQPTVSLRVAPAISTAVFFLSAPVSVRDNVPPAVIGCPLAPQACVLSFLEVNAAWDRRDNALEPRAGTYVGLMAGVGLSQTDQLRPMLKLVPEARGYASFGAEKRVTLAAKLRLGVFFSRDNETPVVARFFSGGSQMRGFNQRRLSPQVAVPSTEDVADPVLGRVTLPDYEHGQTLSVGGNGLLEASLELRWNVSGDFVLAVFNDWGLVTQEPLGPSTDFSQSLYTAIGVGMRYRLPLGPLRVDLGYRLPMVGGPLALDARDVKKFRNEPGCFFGLDRQSTYESQALDYSGSPDSPCSLHLSIGEAF